MGADTFAANLQRVGLAANETQVLLAAYAETGDWAKVRQLAMERNLLGKRSTTTAVGIVKAVARRYLKGPEWLPDARTAGSFFAEPSVPARAKSQVAFLYTVAEDALVQLCLEGVVLGRGAPRSGRVLHPDDVLSFLRALETGHPELARWRPYLCRRWAQGFLALLRDSGFMEPAPSWLLSRPVILPEAFGFVFPWLVRHTESARAALSHRALRWWGLGPGELRELLAAGQDRGWWRYAVAGSMIEFEPLGANHGVPGRGLG